MWYYEDDLTNRLKGHSRDELIRFIVTLYNKRIPAVVRDVNQFVVTDTDPDQVFSQLQRYSAGEAKKVLEAEVKKTKDKGVRVETYFSFIEKVLEMADKLDHRYIGVASAAFGKAMTILGNNVDLWDTYEERAYKIAETFYNMRGAHAWKAVEYYQDGKNEHKRRTGAK